MAAMSAACPAPALQPSRSAQAAATAPPNARPQSCLQLPAELPVSSCASLPKARKPERVRTGQASDRAPSQAQGVAADASAASRSRKSSELRPGKLVSRPARVPRPALGTIVLNGRSLACASAATAPVPRGTVPPPQKVAASSLCRSIREPQSNQGAMFGQQLSPRAAAQHFCVSVGHTEGSSRGPAGRDCVCGPSAHVCRRSAAAGYRAASVRGRNSSTSAR